MKGAKNIMLLAFIAMNVLEQPAPEMRIEQGIVRGMISGDGTVHEYMGIPYATVGEKRFQAPLPPPSWEGVYNAVDEHYTCAHGSLFGVLELGMTECLIVNVFAPAQRRGPLPVMVYIHGGAFVLGSADKMLYNPGFLVQHDVIVVSFNYRLGARGFLCLGIEEAPGNAGLKDQVAALRWVKKNIAAFGGDPDNVTLFGQSAGGTSTSLLVQSDATNGLFNRAIIMSGSSISSWTINSDPVWVASLIAKALGYPETRDPHELYEIFSKVPLTDLAKVKAKKPFDRYLETELMYLPCVEKRLPGVEAIIPDVPYKMATSPARKNISIMHGTTDREGIFLIALENEERMSERNRGYMFASDLEFESEEQASAESKRVNKYYFGDDPISMKKILNVSELYTDYYFEIQSILESEIFLETSDQPVFNYHYKYSGSRNFVKYLSGYRGAPGACHGDELLYLFNGWLWPFPINADDRTVIYRLTRMWTNFAKYGDPTPALDASLPVRWAPSERGNIRVLHIDKELSMGTIPNREMYDLWKGLYQKYRRTKLKSYQIK
ncbi:hypothetical protein JYU34_017016 [Plutella xylostella]|uniref:Carboxylic ester hydrolase n=1 Tax=Plutella xylostella TaxID=51655 RepID=A0ABQ7Q419_PLUXY|nr:hypothetical protein JYU34_017016 [Plutella xylostella]